MRLKNLAIIMTLGLFAGACSSETTYTISPEEATYDAIRDALSGAGDDINFMNTTVPGLRVAIVDDAETAYRVTWRITAARWKDAPVHAPLGEFGEVTAAPSSTPGVYSIAYIDVSDIEPFRLAVAYPGISDPGDNSEGDGTTYYRCPECHNVYNALQTILGRCPLCGCDCEPDEIDQDDIPHLGIIPIPGMTMDEILVEFDMLVNSSGN